MARDPKPGDLIEIFRGPYQHWAIYVEDGYVVHITSDENSRTSSGVSLGCATSSSTVKAVARRDRLAKVVGTDKWRVNNKRGKPLPVAEILSRCHQVVNSKLPYSICTRNCEHFVTYLRFGRPHSEQADTLLVGVGIVGILGTVVLGALVAFARIL